MTRIRPEKPLLPAPVAFVFTSGGGRAAAQVGMMTALAEAGITPDLFISSSFGSINAAAYAAVETDEYDRVSTELRELWGQIGTESAFASPGATIVRRLTVSRGSKTTRAMRELISRLVPDEPLSALTTPLIPVATDLSTGSAASIIKGSTLDAVLASCAVPVLLSPITMDNDILFDGGFAQCAPVRPALAAGAKSIVILDAGASTVPEPELSDLRWWEVAATAYDHLMRGQVGHDLTHVAKQIPVFTVGTEYGNVFDFSDPAGMISAGRECTQAALPLLKSLKCPGIYNIPIGFESYAPFADLIRARR